MDPLTALETSTRIAAGDVGILDIVDAALEGGTCRRMSRLDLDR